MPQYFDAYNIMRRHFYFYFQQKIYIILYGFTSTFFFNIKKKLLRFLPPKCHVEHVLKCQGARRSKRVESTNNPTNI